MQHVQAHVHCTPLLTIFCCVFLACVQAFIHQDADDKLPAAFPPDLPGILSRWSQAHPTPVRVEGVPYEKVDFVRSPYSYEHVVLPASNGKHAAFEGLIIGTEGDVIDWSKISPALDAVLPSHQALSKAWAVPKASVHMRQHSNASTALQCKHGFTA